MDAAVWNTLIREVPVSAAILLLVHFFLKHVRAMVTDHKAQMAELSRQHEAQMAETAKDLGTTLQDTRQTMQRIFDELIKVRTTRRGGGGGEGT